MAAAHSRRVAGCINTLWLANRPGEMLLCSLAIVLIGNGVAVAKSITDRAGGARVEFRRSGGCTAC